MNPLFYCQNKGVQCVPMRFLSDNIPSEMPMSNDSYNYEHIW